MDVGSALGRWRVCGCTGAGVCVGESMNLVAYEPSSKPLQLADLLLPSVWTFNWSMFAVLHSATALCLKAVCTSGCNFAQRVPHPVFAIAYCL